MNIVPTDRTRAIARHMIATAVDESGADAVLRLLPKVHVDQVPALIGVLLTNTRLQAKVGRQRLPDQFTPEERREANRRYKRGARDDWTMAAWREYQRVNRRTYVARMRRRPDWAPRVESLALLGQTPNAHQEMWGVICDNRGAPEGACDATPGLDRQPSVEGRADRG